MVLIRPPVDGGQQVFLTSCSTFRRRRGDNHTIVGRGVVNPAGLQETMSESNDPKPNQPAGTPVPDLIEQYRLRRDAWIAQADELARLRDEVRGSAEREAMEIVTGARRNVRQIVMEARRELLVLSAQVQAALGEAGARPGPGALLNPGDDTDGGTPSEDSDLSDTVFAPEEAVKGMLEEARADMDALVEDARTVPFQALRDAPALMPPPEPLLEEPFITAPPPPVTPVTVAEPPLSASTSRVLLSSQFPSEAVPVPSGSRARNFVALFGVIGVVIAAGTLFWWLRSPAESSPDAARSTTTPPAATASSAVPPVASSASSAASTSAPSSPAPAANAAPSSGLSLLVEARRSSWLRTTIDGESDSGRTLDQGETFRITAQRSVSLRAGDAGAVFVSVNNGAASPLGAAGQPVTRQFVVENSARESGPRPQPAAPSAKPELLSPPTASAGPRQQPGPTPGPLMVPFVQPVVATPPPSAPEPAPSPSSPALRTEAPRPETVVPPPAPRAELPTPGPSTPASAVLAASRQWLDAYHRQDRTAMASLSSDGLQLADERRNEERFPASVDVNRTLDKVSVQIAADTAVLTAVMTERSADNGVPPRVSPVSQVWELRGNQWRVKQVRLVSEARLNQIFR